MGEWAVLGVLVERPRHGFAVAAELASGTELGSAWTVRRPLVYRAVEHLVDVGLVRYGREERGAAGPRRRIVTPTAAGRRHLRRWLDEPVAHLRDVRSELLVKLLLRQRLGLDVASLASAQRARFAPVLDAVGAGPDDVVGRWRRASAVAVDGFLAELERT